MYDFQSQSPFTCKMDWGVYGTERAVERGDIIILVDVLSFTTTTSYAVSKGAYIYPCTKDDDPVSLAAFLGAEAAVARGDVPLLGRYSLSPKTFDAVQSGEKIIVPSLNGATCTKSGEDAPFLFAGSFLNAASIGDSVSRLVAVKSNEVTVIACGEREKHPLEKGDLRPAIEDYLGAGAIISTIHCDKSPEAQVCESTYHAHENYLQDLVWESVSGRELRDNGYGDDILRACQVNSLDVVPVLKNCFFQN